MFDLREAFGWLGAARLVGDAATRVRGVSTDTRRIAAGDLFVALRGEHFDANDLAPQAERDGAAAVMVEREVEGLRGPRLVVPDGRIALGEVARGWRGRWSLPVIAVAGSNGKTTTKEMVAAILAQRDGEEGQLATRGNLNNEIGVPLTVLRLSQAHRSAVIELGMNHVGEIDWLARIAQPTVVVITNAQREHQEFMDGVEATAHENGAAISRMGNDGMAVFPGDDPCAPIWRSLAGSRRRLEFGFHPEAAVWADEQSRPSGFRMRVEDRWLEVELAIAGRHNLRNALAAAAACHAIGIDAELIARGLGAFRPVGGRGVRCVLPGGVELIDDSYNANPDSVRAAIDVLCESSGRRLLVLGDMGEVGDHGPAFHREVGRYAASRGVDALFALGDASREVAEAFGAAARHFDSVESLSGALRESLDAATRAQQPVTLLVKGSRFMRMERVIQALAVSEPGQAAGRASSQSWATAGSAH